MCTESQGTAACTNILGNRKARFYRIKWRDIGERDGKVLTQLTFSSSFPQSFSVALMISALYLRISALRLPTVSWGCFHELTVNSSDVHRSIIMLLIYSGDIMMIINHLSKRWHFFCAFRSSLHVYNFPLPQNARDVIDLYVVLGFVNKVHFLHYGS